MLFVLAVVVAGPAPRAASAHGESTPVIRTVVDRIAPAVRGIAVGIVPGLPTNVSLANSTGTEVTVIGDLREPFLRIGPNGVLANANSPTWYASGNPDGIALNLPRSARAGSSPRWMRVSTRPLWAWFDRRVQPPGSSVPVEARQGRRPLRLVDWSLPLRYGPRALRVEGHVEFRPPLGAVVAVLRSPPLIASAIQLGVLPGATPGLYLENRGQEPVTVIGGDGEPFARIGPSGVWVNVRSATYASEQRQGAPTPAGRVRTPSWRKVASVPRYGWIDPRLSYGALEPGENVTRQQRRVVLRPWSVPIETGSGRRVAIGSTDWVPLEQPSRGSPSAAARSESMVWWLAVGASLTVLGSLGALALRRRQARGPIAAHGSRVW